jgi:predicted ABC-type exoprotein transport system permease subunit
MVSALFMRHLLLVVVTVFGYRQWLRHRGPLEVVTAVVLITTKLLLAMEEHSIP